MPKKSLGQHFIACSWVTKKMIQAAELSPSDSVLEIGPGTGILTKELAKIAKKNIAVEKDENLAEELRQTLKKDGILNVQVISGDIFMEYPPSGLDKKFKLIANIPYYLTSFLLRRVLEHEIKPELIVFTVQKEVAERIAAIPPAMNLLALGVQTMGKPELIAKVPKNCFSPRPKVDSEIIKISDISNDYFGKNKIEKNFFFRVVRAGFSQKRKILTNTLTQIFLKKDIEDALKKAKLPLLSRPEELGLGEWAKLVGSLQRAVSRTANDKLPTVTAN